MLVELKATKDFLEAVLDQIIQEDKESGAHILRAGTPVQRSPDQLDSGLMQKLLKNLGLKYDLVILDSPPVLVECPIF